MSYGNRLPFSGLIYHWKNTFGVRERLYNSNSKYTSFNCKLKNIRLFNIELEGYGSTWLPVFINWETHVKSRSEAFGLDVTKVLL